MTAVLAAATLTACATAPASGCVPTPSGPVSQAIKADGELGGELSVSTAYPLEVTTTQRSQLIAGTGEPLENGSTANLSYAFYNGGTGELILNSNDFGAEPVPFVYQEGTSIEGMEAALHCATVGSRIVAVIPAEEGFGAEGVADVGLEPGQSLILVADIVSIEETATADGTTPEGESDLPTVSAWTSDVPVVDLAASPPTVTIPDTAPPAELVLTVLEEGDGEVVPNPATVTVDYIGTSWDTKEIFDSSYENGGAATFSTGGVIPGFGAAIVGQKVGSTVLVSIPPALAYGPDPAQHQLGGQTLVFLIHIVSYE